MPSTASCHNYLSLVTLQMVVLLCITAKVRSKKKSLNVQRDFTGCQFILMCREQIWGKHVRKVHKQKVEAGTAGGKKHRNKDGTNSHGSTKLKKVVETKSMPVYI